MDFKPGDRLGDRYQLLSKLGEGGMGEVWKAQDTELDRDVAVKVSKSEFTARFKQEARTIAAFNHENICQIYDVGPNYIVMELIDGVPLKGPLPVETAGRLRGPDSRRPRCRASQGFHASRSEAGDGREAGWQ
jgi:serine/threonine protein kinase